MLHPGLTRFCTENGPKRSAKGSLSNMPSPATVLIQQHTANAGAGTTHPR